MRPAREREGRQSQGYRPAHHKSERGIPVARQIQKGQNLTRLVHARQTEAETEGEPDNPSDRVAHAE